MFDFFTNKKTAAQTHEKDRAEGYNLAAGMLLESGGENIPAGYEHASNPAFCTGVNLAIDDYKQLCQKYPVPTTQEQEQECLLAIRKFCDRVELGEVRSRKTYAEFKRILGDTT